MGEEIKTMNFRGLEDPAFEVMKLQTGAECKMAVTQMNEANVDEAEVTLKIKLKRRDDFLENGEIVTKLSMDYKVTRAITLKESADGSCFGLDKYELLFDPDGDPYMRELPKGQQTIDEYM